MNKQQLLYKGKAKSVYATDNPDYVILHFRDDTSALNGGRCEQLVRKGRINNKFNTYIMQKLTENGIETHFERQLNDDEVLVKHLEMIPVECVVRNYSAGSLVRRLGLEEGQKLTPPTYELFYKDDVLGDPMVNESQSISLGWATVEQLVQMKAMTLKVNEVLSELFAKGDMLLVDFKLEFGVFKDRIVLGDEFSPDGCRIWDKATRKKLNKDPNLYQEMERRLGIALG